MSQGILRRQHSSLSIVRIAECDRVQSSDSDRVDSAASAEKRPRRAPVGSPHAVWLPICTVVDMCGRTGCAAMSCEIALRIPRGGLGHLIGSAELDYLSWKSISFVRDGCWRVQGIQYLRGLSPTIHKKARCMSFGIRNPCRDAINQNTRVWRV